MHLCENSQHYPLYYVRKILEVYFKFTKCCLYTHALEKLFAETWLSYFGENSNLLPIKLSQSAGP